MEVNINRIWYVLINAWSALLFVSDRYLDVFKIDQALQDMNEENVAEKLSHIIHIFVKDGRYDSLRFLLQVPNIDLNVQDEYGKTPMDYTEDLKMPYQNKELIVELLNSYVENDWIKEITTCMGDGSFTTGFL
ncbi:MAG: ankyrin repeat domain-containing protein [Rickettsiaceae bacterium]|nr:ankyrin repeat domain-containing protein [Rickettsiaceae bacterium]